MENEELQKVIYESQQMVLEFLSTLDDELRIKKYNQLSLIKYKKLESLTKEQENSFPENVLAFYNMKDNTIYILNDAYQLKKTLIHETLHALSYSTKDVYSVDGFMESFFLSSKENEMLFIFNRAINEGATEFYANKIFGNNYHSSYQVSEMFFEILNNVCDRNVLKNCYLNGNYERFLEEIQHSYRLDSTYLPQKLFLQLNSFLKNTFSVFDMGIVYYSLPLLQSCFETLFEMNLKKYKVENYGKHIDINGFVSSLVVFNQIIDYNANDSIKNLISFSRNEALYFVEKYFEEEYDKKCSITLDIEMAYEICKNLDNVNACEKWYDILSNMLNCEIYKSNGKEYSQNAEFLCSMFNKILKNADFSKEPSLKNTLITLCFGNEMLRNAQLYKNFSQIDIVNYCNESRYAIFLLKNDKLLLGYMLPVLSKLNDRIKSSSEVFTVVLSLLGTMSDKHLALKYLKDFYVSLPFTKDKQCKNSLAKSFVTTKLVEENGEDIKTFKKILDEEKFI